MCTVEQLVRHQRVVCPLFISADSTVTTAARLWVPQSCAPLLELSVCPLVPMLLKSKLAQKECSASCASVLHVRTESAQCFVLSVIHKYVLLCAYSCVSSLCVYERESSPSECVVCRLCDLSVSQSLCVYGRESSLSVYAGVCRVSSLRSLSLSLCPSVSLCFSVPQSLGSRGPHAGGHPRRRGCQGTHNAASSSTLAALWQSGWVRHTHRGHRVP